MMLSWQGTAFGILLLVTVARVQANDEQGSGSGSGTDMPMIPETCGPSVPHQNTSEAVAADNSVGLIVNASMDEITFERECSLRTEVASTCSMTCTMSPGDCNILDDGGARRRRAPIIFQPENVFIVSISESNGQSDITLYIEVPVQYTLLDGELSVIPLATAVDIVQASEANIEMALGLNVVDGSITAANPTESPTVDLEILTTAILIAIIVSSVVGGFIIIFAIIATIAVILLCVLKKKKTRVAPSPQPRMKTQGLTHSREELLDVDQA